MTTSPDPHTWPDLSHLDIMLDIDDVLHPWYAPVHDACREAGLHSMPGPGTMWKMHEEYGVPVEQWVAVVDQLATDGLYLRPPEEQTMTDVRRLHWAGARIHLVTARGFMARADEIRAWTHQWVEEYAVPHTTLTFAKDKVQAMQEILDPECDGYRRTFDYALDDGWHNYEVLDSAGVPVYLLNQPHNQTAPATRRVDTVGEFVDLIFQEHL